MPNIASKHRNLEKTRKTFPLQISEGGWPCWKFGFMFLASRTIRQYIFVFFDNPVCHSSPRKIIYLPLARRDSRNPEMIAPMVFANRAQMMHRDQSTENQKNKGQNSGHLSVPSLGWTVLGSRGQLKLLMRAPVGQPPGAKRVDKSGKEIQKGE